MNRYRTLLALVVVALVPLLAPAGWLGAGAFPDLALLVVAYVAIEVGPAPAAWVGVAAGLLGTPWTADPLGQASFVLGATGLLIGVVRQSLYRDLVSVQLALVVVGALTVRLAGAWMAGGADLALRTIPAALLSAAATAVAAPPVFGLLAALRVQRRRRRGAAGV